MRALLIVASFVCFWQSYAKNGGEYCNKKAVNEGKDLNMDVVYTYVNGNDEHFLKEKKEHEKGEADKTDRTNKKTRTSDAINTRRFTDHDELRISIRSVLKNMPWVRCIYIVVANGEKQVPEWFNKNQDRVQIVRHADIFENSEDLPTYNSHAIEANLHRIKNLARFFLYMNDDFYINAPVKISDFVEIDSLAVKPSFKETIIGKKESPKVRKMAYTAANINNKKVLVDLGVIKSDEEVHYLSHVGYIQDKNVWEDVMQINEVDAYQKATSKRRFRNKKDLWFPGFVTLFNHAKHTSPTSSLVPCYIESKRAKKLKKLIKKCIDDERGKTAEDRQYQLLCINDVVDTDEQKLYSLIQHALQKEWPDPSVAEKNSYHPDRRPENPDPDALADEENEEDLQDGKENDKQAKQVNEKKAGADDKTEHESQKKKPEQESQEIEKEEKGDEDSDKKHGQTKKKDHDPTIFVWGQDEDEKGYKNSRFRHTRKNKDPTNSRNKRNFQQTLQHTS